MSVPSLLREVGGEVTELLRDLIRIDTTNPPGNEMVAAQYLHKILEKEGFTCETFESVPGRGSIVTRLRGGGKGPSLLLLSHLDVVAANPEEWSVDPFGGVVKDGFVWGRGALDMKSMTAVEVTVMSLLKRNGIKLKGDVVLAATADEEKGGEAGAGWLVSNHPDKVRADYVINEGDGLAMPVDRKNIFTVGTAEKGILWFRVKAKGTSGHGSKPDAADNAILRLNKVVEKLAAYRSEIVLLPTVRQYFEGIAQSNAAVEKDLTRLLKEPANADRFLNELAQKDKALADKAKAMVRMTVTPTMIHGGVKENIIPSRCEAVFDCRVMPGQSAIEALELFKGLLEDVGLDKLEFEIIQANDPSESVQNTSLYSQIVRVLREFEPDCKVIPDMLTGGTDSRFFRKMGSVCYGFQPMHVDMPYAEMMSGIHGVDERISVENLVFGTSVLYKVVERFMT